MLMDLTEKNEVDTTLVMVDFLFSQVHGGTNYFFVTRRQLASLQGSPLNYDQSLTKPTISFISFSNIYTLCLTLSNNNIILCKQKCLSYVYSLQFVTLSGSLSEKDIVVFFPNAQPTLLISQQACLSIYSLQTKVVKINTPEKLSAFQREPRASTLFLGRYRRI